MSKVILSFSMHNGFARRIFCEESESSKPPQNISRKLKRKNRKKALLSRPTTGSGAKIRNLDEHFAYFGFLNLNCFKCAADFHAVSILIAKSARVGRCIADGRTGALRHENCLVEGKCASLKLALLPREK